MHYLGLLGFIVTAVGATSGYRFDSAPAIARAYPGRFDISSVHTTRVKTVKYTPPDREPVKTTDFSYTVVNQGGRLTRRDNWVPIPSEYVTIDPDPRAHGAAIIQVSQLGLDPNTRYAIGYQVSAGGQYPQSYPFTVERTNDSQPSSSSLALTSSSTVSNPRTITSAPSTVQLISSTTPPDATSLESSFSSTQITVNTVVQASTTTLAPSAPSVTTGNTSGSSSNTGSATPGINHCPSTWFWSLLLVPIFWAF